jgi:tRNA(fMet)-specific endonuclease VapC
LPAGSICRVRHERARNASLLDTDILSEVFKQRDAQVRQHAVAYLQQWGQFYFSAVTRFEIIRGYKDVGATTQLDRFARFCQHCTILQLTDAVFDRAADLWVEARRGGHPRGDADLLIAATAMEQGLTLVTGNAAHFSWISGIEIANWRQP